MVDNDDSKYRVGYKKPPRHTQFKPGRSGNAKGRPKGAKNFTTVMEEELQARIEVTENGKRKRISKQRAIVKQTVNRAAAGDPRATSILLIEDRFRANQNQLPIVQSLVVGREDQTVMDNIRQRIRQSEPSEPAALDSCPPAGPPSEDEPTPQTDPDEGEL